jgi:hypothetical protein
LERGASARNPQDQVLLPRDRVDGGTPSPADHGLLGGSSRESVGILQPLRDLVGSVVEGVLIFALRVISFQEDAAN